jgi:hypothetical protein
VTWQRRAIGVMTLVLLTLIPATATLCAIVCHDHHDAAAHCQESTESSSRVQLRAARVHDCGVDATFVAEIVAPAQLRMVPPAPASDHLLPQAARSAHPTTALTFASGAPPGSAPPTTHPSVLRV